MNVGIYLITDVIVSSVDRRFPLPNETLLKGKQAQMQLELYYKWLGKARHQMWIGLATFAWTT